MRSIIDQSKNVNVRKYFVVAFLLMYVYGLYVFILIEIYRQDFKIKLVDLKEKETRNRSYFINCNPIKTVNARKSPIILRKLNKLGLNAIFMI